MSITRLLAATAFAALVTGCSGIGDGSKIERIEIVQDFAAFQAGEPQPTARAFQCVTTQLALIGTFTQGDRGNFSSRANWSSSSESILKVSTRGQPVPNRPGEVYNVGGLLLPQGPAGTATVTAEYLGLRTSIEVRVESATDVRIVPASARVAPESFQRYRIFGKLGDENPVDTEITTAAVLQFETPDTAFATIGLESGQHVVRGVAARAEPFTIQADFGVPCPMIQQATVTVADIPDGGLVLSFEDKPGLRDGKIAEATSEYFVLRAHFGDLDGDSVQDADEVQDLSTQLGARYGLDRDGDGSCELLLEGPESDRTTPVPLLVGGTLAGINVVTALDDADADGVTETLCASFGGGDPDGSDGPQPPVNGMLSNELQVEVVDVPLDALSIAVSDPCTDSFNTGCAPLDEGFNSGEKPRIKGGQRLQLDAIGSFAIGEGYQQSVTRNVRWASDNSGLAGVITGLTLNAGLTLTATDFESVTGCEGLSECEVTITATWDPDPTDPAEDRTATVTVVVERAAADEPPA